VKSIHHTSTQVEVFVEGGKGPFTVPEQRLLKIKWKPRLSVEQMDAGSQLQYSRIMKTAVLFNEGIWKPSKGSGFSVFTSRVSDYCFDSTHHQKGQPGILCSHSIGDKADDLASEPSKAKVKKWIREDILAVMGIEDEKAKQNFKAIGVKTQAWQKVDWIGGAYAFYRPGQCFTVRPILQRPHCRVLFAGEHLAELQGFMEGPVNTAQAAAGQL
jgi:monoamine oxidase